MTPVEALTQIRALCDEADEHGTDTGVIDTVDIRAVLDAVSVDATPPQGAHLDALWAIYDRYSIPNDVQEQRGLSFDDFRSRVLALVRPVEGIVLSPEDAAFAAEAMRRSWNTTASLEWNERREALASRLGALS